MPSERVQRRIDALLDDADAALAERDWQATAEICQAVLVLDAANEDAGSYLAAAQKALSERGNDANSRREEVSEEKFPVADPEAVGEALEGHFSSDTSVNPTSASPPPISSMELSFADGRYQVKDLLGEGGKKRSTLPTTPRSIATWPSRSSRWKASTM